VLDYTGSLARELVIAEARRVAEATRLPIEIISVTDDVGVEAAFSGAARKQFEGLLVNPGAFFYLRREQIIKLAAQHAVPAAYHLREYPEAGGLMSYGSTVEEGYRQVGVYTGRVLKGAKPADLPVIQSTKFEFVINLKTAEALSLTFHRSYSPSPTR
jgi:putative tryptophan/tyrosine transport system substrate-binding protein